MFKKLFLLLIFSCAVSSVFSIELIPTRQLLAGYLEQDSDLKNQMLELKKAEISRDSTQIDKGINVKLATGDMTFTAGNQTSFSVSPSVSVTMPEYSNMGVDVGASFGTNNGSASFNSASAKVSVDILSSNTENRNIALLKSERQVLEAQRSLNSKAIDKEKSFYNELNNLLNSISNIITKDNTIYDDYTSLEKIKLQGYAENSVQYMKAELKYMTSQRDFENSLHTLISDYKIFYNKCGFEIDIPDDVNFIELVPKDITLVEPLDINTFDKQKYSQIESALWNQKVNKMTRDAEKKFTLTANGGYSYKNSTGGGINSLEAGVNGTYEGLGVSVKVSAPINSDVSSPSVSVGLTYSPNTSKKNALSQMTTEISIEQENMKIADAESNYENTVKEKIIKLEDLNWTKSSNMQNYEMNKKLENEYLKYYQQGLISEKDYKSTVINTQQTEIKDLINIINYIIYNDEIKALFVD